MKKKIKSKCKNFIISLDVYPFDIMVSVGEESAVLFKKLIKAGVSDKEVLLAEYENIGDARYCLFEDGQSLIRIKSVPKTPKEYGHLQHEIFHCASAILWRIGMKLKIKTSDEAYAYLIQFLTERIYLGVS